MIIKINENDCEHLEKISCYNNNYYRVPFEINGCNVIYVRWCGSEDSCMYFLGRYEDGEFGEERASEFYSVDDMTEAYEGIIVLDSDCRNVWLT